MMLHLTEMKVLVTRLSTARTGRCVLTGLWLPSTAMLMCLVARTCLCLVRPRLVLCVPRVRPIRLWVVFIVPLEVVPVSGGRVVTLWPVRVSGEWLLVRLTWVRPNVVRLVVVVTVIRVVLMVLRRPVGLSVVGTMGLKPPPGVDIFGPHEEVLSEPRGV